MRDQLQKRIKSFGFAIKGIKELYKSEFHAKIHTVATILVLLMGVFYQISLMDWSILTIAIIGVWVAETINTAIERIVDVISPQWDEKAGIIKDLAAGAVLISSLGAAIVGGIIFFKYFFQ